MEKSIIVTGSSGTIGTALCAKLMGPGLTCIDSQPNKWVEFGRAFARGDLRRADFLPPRKADVFVHLAANARVYNLVREPQLAKDNIDMVFNALEFCRKSDTKRFIFASSREVYGNSGKIVHSENEAYVQNCESTYTASKIAGEAMVHAYAQNYGIDYTIVRFSNVYGRYDDKDRLVPLYISRALRGEDLVVFGRDKILDFTFIDDAINGLMRCISSDAAVNNVFNIASGRGTTITSVAEIVKAATNSTSRITFAENRTGEVVRYVADIRRAQQVLGYEPRTAIEDGISKAVEWQKGQAAG